MKMLVEQRRKHSTAQRRRRRGEESRNVSWFTKELNELSSAISPSSRWNTKAQHAKSAFLHERKRGREKRTTGKPVGKPNETLS